MTTEIIPISKIQQALQKENITEQVLAGLRTHLSLKVLSPEDKAGYLAVKDARLECKRLRVLAVKIAKAGRADAIREQEAWIDEEKRVVGQIEAVETYLEGQEAIVEEAKKREEEAIRQRQRERIETRVKSLMAVGVFRALEEIAMMPDSDFDTLLKDSTEKYNAEIARKKKEDDERAELQKKLDAQKAEQDRKDKEQREAQAKIDAENRKIELEKAKKEAEERGRKEAEAKAEREKKQAEEKAQRDADEKKRKEEEAKAEALRLEALKPDKEKLIAFAGEVSKLKVPLLSTDEAKAQVARAVALIDEAIDVLYE